MARFLTEWSYSPQLPAAQVLKKDPRSRPWPRIPFVAGQGHLDHLWLLVRSVAVRYRIVGSCEAGPSVGSIHLRGPSDLHANRTRSYSGTTRVVRAMARRLAVAHRLLFADAAEEVAMGGRGAGGGLQGRLIDVDAWRARPASNYVVFEDETEGTSTSACTTSATSWVRAPAAVLCRSDPRRVPHSTAAAHHTWLAVAPPVSASSV
jgi:hypothetical protein